MTSDQDTYILKLTKNNSCEFFLVKFNTLGSWNTDHYPLVFKTFPLQNGVTLHLDRKRIMEYTDVDDVSVILPDDPELFAYLL